MQAFKLARFEAAQDQLTFPLFTPTEPEQVTTVASFVVDTKLVRDPVVGPGPELSSPDAVAEFLRLIGESDRERLIAIYADRKQRVLGAQEVAIGTRSASYVPVDVIARTAILSNADGVFIAHNHPSGVPEPSDNDVAITRNLRSALEPFEIQLMDHVIIGADGRFYSFRVHGAAGFRQSDRFEYGEPDLEPMTTREPVPNCAAAQQRDPKDRVDWCNLSPGQVDEIWAWENARQVLVDAMGMMADVQVCGSALTPDAFQVTADFSDARFKNMRVETVMDAFRNRSRRILATHAREVSEHGTRRVVLEVALPTGELRPEDLLGGTPQRVIPGVPRPEPGVQPALFQMVPTAPDSWGSRCRNPLTGRWMPSETCPTPDDDFTVDGDELTWAIGPNRLVRYEFAYRVVDLSDVIASHDPFTFEPIPEFPAELQPRLRERAATRVQVERIAANPDPLLLLEEFHALDRGAPIVGPDLVVESGNGRMMALQLAAENFPGAYERYRQALLQRAPELGIPREDVERLERPVLVRERLTDIDRVTFTEEANATTSISRSTVEIARSDAARITVPMLESLEVLEAETLEDALRASRNHEFVTRFLEGLPSEEQAGLLDVSGRINQDGIRRAGTAVFVRAFDVADSGLRLAEKFFEATESDVKNVFNGIARALGPLARAEGLIADGRREPLLSIAQDLATAVNVYSKVRKLGMSVEDYIAQMPLFERELTPFQEQIMFALHERRRSARRIGDLLRAYAELVEAEPDPAQIGLLPMEPRTKEELWVEAMRKIQQDHEPRPSLMPAAQPMPRRVRLAMAGQSFIPEVIGGLAAGIGFGLGGLVAGKIGQHTGLDDDGVLGQTRRSTTQILLGELRDIGVPIYRAPSRSDQGRSGMAVSHHGSWPVMVEWRNTPADEQPWPTLTMLRIQDRLRERGFEAWFPYGPDAQLLVSPARRAAQDSDAHRKDMACGAIKAASEWMGCGNDVRKGQADAGQHSHCSLHQSADCRVSR